MRPRGSHSRPLGPIHFIAMMEVNGIEPSTSALRTHFVMFYANAERVSLRTLEVFHMDECLDWQARELPRNHPYSFRGFMERHFYDPVDPVLAVPEANRVFLTADNVKEVRAGIWSAPIDLTYGGWGQDGHIAYNQARRASPTRFSEA